MSSYESSRVPPDDPDIVFFVGNLLSWADLAPIKYRGLANLGNTCYINSVVQCLLHLAPFRGWLSLQMYHKKCSGVPCVICGLLSALNGGGADSIVNKLNDISPDFTLGEQEDAHSFLISLLEYLNCAFLQSFLDLKPDFYSQCTTPINTLFGMWQKTEVTCPVCANVSTTYNFINEIPLHIVGRNLQDCVNRYFRPEILKMTCSLCKCKEVKCEKSISLHKPPNVLILHLLRFDETGSKVTTPIALPQTLIVPGRESQETFDLTGGIVHLGKSLNNGHYISFSLCPDGKQVIFNDTQVTTVSARGYLQSEEWTEGGYIFMYSNRQMQVNKTSNGYVPLSKQVEDSLTTPSEHSNMSPAKPSVYIVSPVKGMQPFVVSAGQSPPSAVQASPPPPAVCSTFMVSSMELQHQEHQSSPTSVTVVGTSETEVSEVFEVTLFEDDVYEALVDNGVTLFEDDGCEVNIDNNVNAAWTNLPHLDFGLSICGSSSGLNSCLQVLMHTPPFIRLLLNESKEHESKCLIPNCLLCKFLIFNYEIRLKDVVLTAVNDIYKLCLASVINHPMDLLMRVISQLHCEWLRTVDASEHNNMKSPIFQIFSGLYQVESRCKCGFYDSVDKESMCFNVILKANCTFQDALDHKLFGIKVIKWCSQCKTSSEQTESFTLLRVPPVLLIGVQRTCVIEDSPFCPTINVSQTKLQFLGGSLQDENKHCSAVLRCPNSCLVLCNDTKVNKISYSALADPIYANHWCVVAYEQLVSPPEGKCSDASPCRSTSPGWIVTSFEQEPEQAVEKTPSPPIETSTPVKRKLFEDDTTEIIDISVQTTTKVKEKSITKKKRRKTKNYTVELEELHRVFVPESHWSVGCQTQLPPQPTQPTHPPLSFEQCWTSMSEKQFKYCTGIAKAHFDLIFDVLGGDDTLGSLKYEYHLSTPDKNNKIKMSNKGRLFYVLFRCRRGMSIQDLSFLFGVSVGLLSDIFFVFIRHMNLVFSSFKKKMFLTAKQQNRMKPKKFKPFKNLRCIVDTTSFRIQKPLNFQQQGNTYSTYKSGNVANYFVAITSRGAIIYISPGFEGSISDKQAVNLSDFMDYLEPGDQIMTDKGFELKSELLARGVELLKPPLLGDRPNLTPSEQLLTEAIATTRIYVEHAIGRIKQFALLRRVIPNKLLPILDDIVSVCAFLTNFNTPCQIKK